MTTTTLKIITIATAIIVSANAAAQAAPPTVCTKNSSQREIGVVATPDGGCEVIYTKDGQSKAIASSGFGTKYCTEIAAQIESNFKTDGFVCKRK